MGLDGAGAQAGLDFAVSDVNGQNAQALLEELNGTLLGRIYWRIRQGGITHEHHREKTDTDPASHSDQGG